jgi:hypothetical protein
MSQESRFEYLLQLREAHFRELQAAERELTELRLQVERLESDLRIGFPEAASFAEMKGHRLPQAEAVVVNLYRELWKLEDKLVTAPGRSGTR